MDVMQRYGKARPGRRLPPHAFTADPGTPGRVCTCGLPWRNTVHLSTYPTPPQRRRPRS